MKTLYRILTLLMLSLLSLSVYAQDKTQAYYAQHEREIFPDAQIAFSDGNYQRAVILCQWHYIIVGDNAADSLREKAENCQHLLEEMNYLILLGNNEAALEKALALLIFNPEDTAAKALLLEAESAVSEPVEEEVEVIPEPIIIEEDPFYSIEPIVVPEQVMPEPEPVSTETNEITQYFPQIPAQPDNKPVSHKTKFGVKAIASILDLKKTAQSIALGASVGAYDIGGSRFGGELGVLLSPSLSGVSSFFEFDAAISYKISEKIYPLISTGFFSCKSSTGTSPATVGMSAGVGLSFIIGDHFSVDVVGKYYPTVSVQSTETIKVQGISTDFTTVTDALSGGIAPLISLGYRF